MACRPLIAHPWFRRWCRLQAKSYIRGGQLIWLGGHFKKAMFSGLSYLEPSRRNRSKSRFKLASALTVTMVSWRIGYFKFEDFAECFRGPLKILWRPHVARDCYLPNPVIGYDRLLSVIQQFKKFADTCKS